MSDTTFLVVKVPADDYYERTGSYTVALALAADHGGVRSGGGTCFLTGMSDIDLTVPTANLAALTAALDAAGLPYRVAATTEGELA